MMNEHITLTISKVEKKALKQAALDNDCSVSELIRRWLAKYLEEEKKLDEYRVRCLDEAMTDFHNWFWDLWD